MYVKVLFGIMPALREGRIIRMFIVSDTDFLCLSYSCIFQNGFCFHLVLGTGILILGLIAGTGFWLLEFS